MARTEITPTELTANKATAQPAQTEVIAANGAAILAGGKLEETTIEITALEAGGVVTVKAGDNPPALSAGQGDLKIEGLAENAVTVLGPTTSARFIQAGAEDGQLLIDTTKKIKVRAYHVSRAA